MRELLAGLAVPAKKVKAIMERFDMLMSDRDLASMVYVAGSRPAIETVEIYGLKIGIDACGNASDITPIMPGLPQGFDVPELEYDPS